MFIAGKDPDILLITEMIPKQQKCVIPSSLLKIDEYELYCNFEITMENLGASGIRGTAIYVKSGIVSYEVKIENTQHKDQVEIPFRRKTAMRLYLS